MKRFLSYLAGVAGVTLALAGPAYSQSRPFENGIYPGMDSAGNRLSCTVSRPENGRQVIGCITNYKDGSVVVRTGANGKLNIVSFQKAGKVTRQVGIVPQKDYQDFNDSEHFLSEASTEGIKEQNAYSDTITRTVVGKKPFNSGYTPSPIPNFN